MRAVFTTSSSSSSSVRAVFTTSSSASSSVVVFLRAVGSDLGVQFSSGLFFHPVRSN